jgi:hypothetical protein
VGSVEVGALSKGNIGLTSAAFVFEGSEVASP